MGRRSICVVEEVVGVGSGREEEEVVGGEKRGRMLMDGRMGVRVRRVLCGVGVVSLGVEIEGWVGMDTFAARR